MLTTLSYSINIPAENMPEDQVKKDTMLSDMKTAFKAFLMLEVERLNFVHYAVSNLDDIPDLHGGLQLRWTLEAEQPLIQSTYSLSTNDAGMQALLAKLSAGQEVTITGVDPLTGALTFIPKK